MDILKTALGEFGISEINGPANNRRIVQYSKDIGYGKTVLTEDTAWCSIFINWCAQKSGLESSGKLNARSWLNVGEEVKTPIAGDIVILWRENKTSWKGHVGIYINELKGKIYVLGGNQSNQVKISGYDSGRLLGYRRLNKKQ